MRTPTPFVELIAIREWIDKRISQLSHIQKVA